MNRSRLWFLILTMACTLVFVVSVRAEVVIERLSTLVESAPRTNVSTTVADDANEKADVDPPRGPATVMGALSILGEKEQQPWVPPLGQETLSIEEGSTPSKLRDLWTMRRLAIRMGNDEAALESERLLEDALLERRSRSTVSSTDEEELAYVLLLEAAGAERVGAHSSAAALIHIAALAGPNLPAVHVARARLAWGGTGDFGTVFDGLAAAWVAISKNDRLVSYVGAGVALCFVLGFAVALLGLALAIVYNHGRYMLVDLQSRFASVRARWRWGTLLVTLAAVPLVFGMGPLFTPLIWLTLVGAYLNGAQQRALRGVALLAVMLPYGIWLSASSLSEAMVPAAIAQSIEATPRLSYAHQLYADIATALFRGMPMWAASIALLMFPFCWGWGWRRVGQHGLVGACEICGAATQRSAPSNSGAQGQQESVVCPVCVVRATYLSADGDEKNRLAGSAFRARHHVSRGALWMWTLVWPGWGHLLLGQVARGFRYFLGAGFIWCAWAWWASPIPWPEPVLVNESELLLYLLLTGTVLFYVSALLSCGRSGNQGGHHGN